MTTPTTGHRAPGTDPPAPPPLPAVLRLRTPMPGLPGHHEFTATALDPAGLLHALRSAAPAGLVPVRLFVLDPAPFFPGYRPGLDPLVLGDLGLVPGEALLRVVVRPGEGAAPPTANLLAPLVVHPTTGAAAQVVLAEDWPLRAPLRAET